jgi:hypothetical protein
MVPVPTSYLNVPIFGSGASNIVPEPTTYAGGFLPGQLFPAEYENWLMNRLTTNSLASQTTDLSMAAEIVNILNQASIVPDPVSTTQLYAALNALYATVGALSSEASTRSSADTTLQANINAEATARMNADSTLQANINAEAALARDASNLSSGTVPLARLSGITQSQMASGNGITISDGGVVSGTVTLPTISVGQTRQIYYRDSTSAITSFNFPATGTFNSWSLLSKTGSVIDTARLNVHFEAAGGTLCSQTLNDDVYDLVLQYTRVS